MDRTMTGCRSHCFRCKYLLGNGRGNLSVPVAMRHWGKSDLILFCNLSSLNHIEQRLPRWGGAFVSASAKKEISNIISYQGACRQEQQFWSCEQQKKGGFSPHFQQHAEPWQQQLCPELQLCAVPTPVTQHGIQLLSSGIK